jgi:hypothetical protein
MKVQIVTPNNVFPPSEGEEREEVARGYSFQPSPYFKLLHAWHGPIPRTPKYSIDATSAS